MKAALWMTGAIVSFSLMAVAGRAVAVTLDTFELMMYRSLIGIVIVLGVAGAAGTLSQISRRSLGLHTLRNISHFAGQNLWFAAIIMIPLTQVFALEFTSPLWAMLFATFILGERLSAIRVIGALVGFMGVLIVLGIVTIQLSLSDGVLGAVRIDLNDAFVATILTNIGALLAALAAIGFALSAVFTRKLTRTESITCILFYLTVMQAVFGVITAGYDGDIALPGKPEVPWLLAIACAGLLAHFCLTKALSLAPAAVVMPFDFIRLPLIAVIGLVMFNEQISLAVIFGAIVIFSANYVIVLTESRKTAAKK
nr:DMT family transporter [Sulfitobacter algicola]